MARITVEDCLGRVDNRFDLVLTAAERARQLSRGREAKVDPEQDKPTVVALREIADGLITREIMREEDLFFAAAQAEEEQRVGFDALPQLSADEDDLDKLLAEQLLASAAEDEAGDGEPEKDS